jgi:hypothetical protein
MIVILDGSKDGVAVYDETHDFKMYGHIVLSAISKDPLIIIQGGKKNIYLYFSKIHHLAQEKDVGSACHFNIIGLSAVYNFKLDLSVDYICWMHVLTTQSYLNNTIENEPQEPSNEFEKLVFDNQSAVSDRSKMQAVRPESLSWDIRRNSISGSVKGTLDPKDPKSKYTSPPLSASSSVGGDEKSDMSRVSTESSRLHGHLQKRWSTDIPIKPSDKPSEWQTKSFV